MTEQSLHKSEHDVIPVHKATDNIGPIRSLCEPGFLQIAEQWGNVTCQACLVFRPGSPGSAPAPKVPSKSEADDA